MIDYRNIIKDREFRLKLIDKLRFIPDKPYVKMVFWIKNGKRLNINNPKTFCEKQNWLKLYDVHPEYTQLVDKIAVRDYVTQKIGTDISFPILGVWDSIKDIDFTKLPEKFVLKCNHDSGSVKIIDDKNKIDVDELDKFYKGRMKINPYYTGREYPYKNVKPKIFAEKYMISSGAKDINDYKFFCFDGKPEIMFIATDRNTDVRFDFFDMNFEHLDIFYVHPNSDNKIEKPETFDEMKEIASKLSEGMKFVRIDLYEINGKVYFGEYTIFNGGGFWPILPDEWDKKLGDLIKI